MDRKGTIILTLALLLAASVAYGVHSAARAENYRRQVEDGYRKAFFETCELVSSMQVDLSKLQVTGSGENRRKLLAELALYAQGAQSDLAALPEGLSFSEGALKFFNQAADYAVSDASVNDKLTDRLLTACRALTEELDRQRRRLEQGENIFANMEEERADAETAEATVQYPGLLYDGPFSDGQPESELRLTGDSITPEQAERILADLIGADRVRSVRTVGESDLHTPCYELDAETEDGVLSAAISKTGGRLVYMLCDRQPQSSRFSVAECVDLAAHFLKQKGYGEMQVSYWQRDENAVTVNFAAEQDGVVLYPDLIKVNVSMENGTVIGLEASEYLASHRTREFAGDILSRQKAEDALAASLAITRTRLCVIPLSGGEEAFCYEICAESDDGVFLIYVDAVTGEERNILKIVETENGQLAV